MMARTSRKVLEALVDEGERVLGRRFGEGWRRDIRLSKLDISCPRGCLVGQLYAPQDKGYGDGIIDLMNAEMTADPNLDAGQIGGIHWGFAAESDTDYATLNGIWRRRIAAWLRSQSALAVEQKDAELALSA